MDVAIAVRVPESDREQLEDLVREIGEDVETISASRPFDGETVVQVVLLLGGASYPFFRTWLTQRGVARKSFSIVRDGVEIKGYTASEAAEILDALDKEIGSAAPPDED